jgi:amino acid adenylation domain-containing protein
VSLQELLEDAATHDGSPLHAEIEASAPACVMYTSGSTGRPKGAVIPHRAILRLVHQQSYANFGSDEVFLHMAPLAFDASTFEIWGALLHGGVLVSLPQTQPSLDEIENAINAHGVTTAWFTAALFHAIVDERPSVLSRLKQVLAGGDVLSPSHIARAQAAAPNARFINGYGPTENTTFTACHVIARNGIGNGAIPIGQPIGGSRVYVVDGRGRLAPRGAIGQLVVAGEGLALGYINRPVLSAERFSPCPDAGEAIVYRTGDLAQWRGDGALMFQGRSDGQVKINGMRVELGEVEAALTSSADVGEAAALVLVDNAGAKWIEAWVTPAQAGAPDLQALSATLEQRLPKAMQPRQITVAAQLPRTANGKLDRAALKSQSVRPQAATPLPSNAEPKSTALTALEAKIAAIWQDVLMRQSIRAQDALFTLGADSLHIFRIAARFAEAGIPLQARHLMANPTVAALAEMIERPSDVRDTDGPKSPVSLASFRRGAKRPK